MAISLTPHSRQPRPAPSPLMGEGEIRHPSSLRGASAHPELVEGRGNLDEAEFTSTNRRYYGDEIANPPHRVRGRNDKVGTRESMVAIDASKSGG